MFSCFLIYEGPQKTGHVFCVLFKKSKLPLVRLMFYTYTKPKSLVIGISDKKIPENNIKNRDNKNRTTIDCRELIRIKLLRKKHLWPLIYKLPNLLSK